jgi:predicted alpha/beta superfamily hydrolase
MLASIIAMALAAQAAAAESPPAPSAATTAPATSPAVQPGAVQFDMTSKITGRTYRIYVSAPLGSPPPPNGFPVLYTLDAYMTFGTASTQADVGRTDNRAPMVVVGIGYPDIRKTLLSRNRDMTPSPPTGATLTQVEKDYGPAKPDAYGDAEGFHRFMTEELRPLIAQSYRTDPKNQSLMGYSFGGLFALHVLFQHPRSYQGYVIGSPSIWWNDREVLKDENAFGALVKAGKVAPRILITSDQWEQFEGDPTLPPPGAERRDMLAELSEDRMVDNARELAARLTALQGGAGYKVRYTLFPEETHLSGMAASTSRGIAFIAVP